MKMWKIVGGAFAVLIAISILGGFILDITGYEAESPESTQAPEEVAKASETITPVTAEVESPEISPLSKDEILAKFPAATDEESYENGQFQFVGNRTDTADYYWLAPSDTFEDARVIFKDGEIAAIKLWLSEGADVGKAFEAFGIADAAENARKQNDYANVYEYAIIPIYWTQNIELYPNEFE